MLKFLNRGQLVSRLLELSDSIFSFPVSPIILASRGRRWRICGSLVRSVGFPGHVWARLGATRGQRKALVECWFAHGFDSCRSPTFASAYPARRCKHLPPALLFARPPPPSPPAPTSFPRNRSHLAALAPRSPVQEIMQMVSNYFLSISSPTLHLPLSPLIALTLTFLDVPLLPGQALV